VNFSKTFAVSFLTALTVLFPFLIWMGTTHTMKDITVAILLAADFVFIFIGIELMLMASQDPGVASVGELLSTSLLTVFVVLFLLIIWADTTHAIKDADTAMELLVFDVLFIFLSGAFCVLAFTKDEKCSKEACQEA